MAGYGAPEMVTTPWGDASTLRERRLSPGRGTPREEARRNQRERLFAAMVAMTATKGYPEISVADLVEISGVSSRSFYQQFAGKDECFLATMDEILLHGLGLSEGALQPRDPGLGRAPLLVETFVGMVAAQPAAARLCMVSGFCAGERPRARIQQAVTELSALVQQELEKTPDRDGMPVELTEAILGGVALVIYRRLARGELDGLEELAPELGSWVLSIPPPPGPLRSKGRRRQPAGKSQSPQPLTAHLPSERILRGFMAVVAEKGYAAATIADIAAQAHISQSTFYKHFRDKDDALEAALDSSGARLVAATLPAVRRNGRWPDALRVALEAICGFLMSEPDVARLRVVEVYAVGPEAVAYRDSAQAEILRELQGLARQEEFGPVTREATRGIFQSLLGTRIAAGRLQALAEVPPIVTYLTLAPSLGAQAAYETACA